MLEDWPVAMPADAGARIVADEERLNELVVGKVHEGGAEADRQEPVGHWRRGGDLCCLKVIGQAKGGGQPPAEPSLKAERC